jgi:hypothetical protein
MHIGDLMRRIGCAAAILVAIFVHHIGEFGSARAESKASAKRSAAGSALTSHWNHNGSLVSLVSEGSKQKFIYSTPRVGLLDAGVKPGTLLFEGQKNGQNIDGTAYQFYRTCKSHGFQVTGSTSDDRRQITLKGKAPQLDLNCNVTGTRDDVLVFSASQSSPNETAKDTLVASAPAAKPVAVATGATPSAPATNFPSEANRGEASKATAANTAFSATAAVAPSEPPKDNSKDKQIAATPPQESKPAPPAELAKSEAAKSEPAKDAKPPVAAQTAVNTPAATSTAAPPSEPAKKEVPPPAASPTAANTATSASASSSAAPKEPAKDHQPAKAPGENVGATKPDPSAPAGTQAAAPPSEPQKATQVAAIPGAGGSVAKADDASKSKVPAIPEAVGSVAKADDAGKSKTATAAVVVTTPHNLPEKSNFEVSGGTAAQNKTAPAQPAEKMMEIVLKNGRVLRIGRDIDPDALMRIIALLER